MVRCPSRSLWLEHEAGARSLAGDPSPTPCSVVELLHYVNDIQGAAAQHGRTTGPDLSVQPAPLRWLVDNSYLVNFVYWRGIRSFHETVGGPRWPSMEEDYTDEAIRGTHRDELEAVVDFCREENIALAVVCFPRLTDVGRSRSVTAQVTRFFRSKGVKMVLDLGKTFAGRNPEDMIVSEVDADPDEGIHKEVADRVHRQLGEHHVLRWLRSP